MTETTGWDNGLCQDYNRALGRWFADRLGAREQLRRMFAKEKEMTDVQELMKLADGCMQSARSDANYGLIKSAATELCCAALESALQQQAAEIERLERDIDHQITAFNAVADALNKAAPERDALKAKLDEAEKQEPVGLTDNRIPGGVKWSEWAAVPNGTQLYTRPIPSQDVNAGLVKALELCYDHCRLYHPEVERNNVGKTVRVALSSAQSAPARVVADGCVLVPVEPDSAMLDRAVAFMLQVSLGGKYGWSEYARDVYKRMLSAAPQPQEGAKP